MSITRDLWSTVTKYGLCDDVVEYLTRGRIITKILWKQCVKASVLRHENLIYREGLTRKGALRFLRIHPGLAPYPMYSIIKSHMKLRPQLMNLIKLLSYPQTTVECTCNVCDRSFTDCVDHYIMRCEGLITERMDLWDRLLDCVPCELEVKIIRMNDVETLDLLLS